MGRTPSERNPLQPLSMPLALRAAAGITLAIWMLLDAAPAIMAGVSGFGFLTVLASLVLLAFSLLDATHAFYTGLRLPSRSLGAEGISANYTAKEIEALMLSGSSPNEKFLTWIGKWVSRASDRFCALPPAYQRLLEVALASIAFGTLMFLFFLLVAAFIRAGGQPDVSSAILSWVTFGFVLLAYVYWVGMAINIYSAANWGKTLSIARLVRIVGSAVLTIVAITSLSHIFGIKLREAPPLDPWSYIAAAGSAILTIAILLIARMRVDDTHSKMERSQIRLSDAAGVHPQSVLSAFRSILAQAKTGTSSEMGDETVTLDEQEKMAGGTFSALAAGEYGAVLMQLTLPKPIRTLATILGYAGIAVGAYAYFIVFSTGSEPSFAAWLTAAALFLFSEMAVLIASIPLSETLWKSHLLAIWIHGNYQNKGNVLMTDGRVSNSAQGSIMTDYSLAGGIATAYSASYLNAAMVKPDTRPVLISTSEDREELDAVLKHYRTHIARAAGQVAPELTQK